ncbi:Dixin [Chamberlinius hualienensis]
MNLKKLLSGHPNEPGEHQDRGTNTFVGTSAEEKLVALQSYLQKTSEKCHDLHSNLKKTQQECADLEDVKSSLHEKVVEQDKFMLEMKQEVAKLELENQSLETKNQEFLKTLEMKEQQLIELRRQLNSKDKLIHQQKSQLDEAIRNLSSANKSKACLTSRLVEQDRKIAVLEQARNHKTPMREELQIVRDALQSLRSSFKSNEPQHHTIDTLEQSFALVMERLHMAEMEKISNNHGDSKKLNFDSTGDPRRFPLSSYQSYCLQKLENNSSTKVVYFTEKTVTPFMSSIPKKLGEIALSDFKTMFDRPGNFRYHFKSLDGEYGMVKEEIMHDDDILPGWDGKIIAWVEEDHG